MVAIPEKWMVIIRATCNGAKCRVLNRGKISEKFGVESRVYRVVSDIISSSIGNFLHAALAGGRGRIQFRFRIFSSNSSPTLMTSVCLVTGSNRCRFGKRSRLNWIQAPRLRKHLPMSYHGSTLDWYYFKRGTWWAHRSVTLMWFNRTVDVHLPCLLK